MREDVDFTPEEKAEIRKARWNGAKIGLRHMIIPSTVLGIGAGIDEHNDGNNRIRARKEQIAYYDRHISQVKRRFVPRNQNTQQYSLNENDAKNSHNEINNYERYKRQTRKEIDNIDKSKARRSVGAGAVHALGLYGLSAVGGALFNGSLKKDEIINRRAIERRKMKEMAKTAAEMIRKTKFKRLSSKELEDRASVDGSVRSEASAANRYASKHGTGNEAPGTQSLKEKDFDYYKEKWNHGIEQGKQRVSASSEKQGLSTGAKLGIGAGGTLIGALALRRYLKKRRQAKEQGESK